MNQPLGNPSHIGNLSADQIGPQPTFLPADHPDAEARERMRAGEEAADVVSDLPASCLAWSVLADEAYDEGRTVDSYAYARVGYHRGLDALRQAGWRGAGPIPYSHEMNRGFLRSLYALGRVAATIGEGEEAQRIERFLRESDPAAADLIASSDSL